MHFVGKIKKTIENFDDLPPLETVLADELKTYTREQLCWYLEQQGITPEETKPKMKAQLREVLKRIQDPSDRQAMRKYRVSRPGSSSVGIGKIISLNCHRSPLGSGTLPIQANVNHQQLKKAMLNPIPCTVATTQIPNQNAKPYVNIKMRSFKTNGTAAKYSTNVELVEALLSPQAAPTTIQNIISTQQRITFLKSLKRSLEQKTSDKEIQKHTKYFKTL